MLVVLVAACLGTRASAWMTVDGGENITMHGTVNIGPVEASEMYDLYVHGDVSIEKVREGLDASLTVEGELTTERVNFRDIPYSAASDPRALDQQSDQYVYFATIAGSSNQTVVAGRSYLEDGERKEQNFFIVQTGTADDEAQGILEGDANITVAGKNSLFRLRGGYGKTATMQLVEDAEVIVNPDTGEETLSDPSGVNTAFTLENRAGALAASGTRGYAILRLEDFRPGDEAGQPWAGSTAFSEYEKSFPVSFNVTEYGGEIGRAHV